MGVWFARISFEIVVLLLLKYLTMYLPTGLHRWICLHLCILAFIHHYLSIVYKYMLGVGWKPRHEGVYFLWTLLLYNFFHTKIYQQPHESLSHACNSNPSQHIQSNHFRCCCVVFKLLLFASQCLSAAKQSNGCFFLYDCFVSFLFFYSLWEVRWFHVWELNFYILFLPHH